MELFAGKYYIIIGKNFGKLLLGVNLWYHMTLVGTSNQSNEISKCIVSVEIRLRFIFYGRMF